MKPKRKPLKSKLYAKKQENLPDESISARRIWIKRHTENDSTPQKPEPAAHEKPRKEQTLARLIWIKRHTFYSVAFWLVVWQLASMAINKQILLVSPVSVLIRLGALVIEGEFWRSIGFSLVRILAGFLLGAVVGVVFAALSVRFKWVSTLLKPLMTTIKAVPVASFVILVLIWVSSKNLSVLITFLIVLPIIYTNTRDGIIATDPKLLEMARVFDISKGRQIRYIYLSQVLPFFRSACSIALGLSWKSGVAAEVIGIPDGSIGEKLYKAKIYLDTPDLFAWTVVIVILSFGFERLMLKLLDICVRRLERI